MLFSGKKLLLLSLLTVIFPISPLLGEETVQPPVSHAVTPFDKVIDEGQRQLTKIRICLNSISALIKKNQTYTPQAQQKIIHHFIELDRLIINSLRNEKFIHADLESAYLLLQINNALIEHINTAMSTNFKGIETFNLEEFLTKATKATTRGFKPEEILKQLIINNQKIEQLNKKALGLTWYNKFSRSVDEWVISPVQKYSLVSRGLMAGTALFLSSYLLWQLNYPYFEQLTYQDNGIDPNTLNKFQKTVRFAGEKIYGIPSHQLQKAEESRGLIGGFENLVGRYTQGHTVIGKFAFLGLSAGIGYEFKKNIYPALVKYFDVAKNKLKGGAYLKEAERAAEKVEHVRFKDIFGQHEIIRYMQLIVDYLEDPETFDRLGLTPPKGILCIGDTRTGKTFTISALFGEINDMLKRTGQTGKFKLIKLDVLSIKVEGMETILRRVRQNAPCIVFIDEIDLLDLQRTGENRTLSEFLTAMSDTVGSKDSKKQVIIIAATNRPETLDVALRQPGRFGKELRFEYPNYTDRHKFITARLQELSLTSEQFDIKKLAQFTENKSYEALNMLIKNAIIKARLRNEILTQAHLDEALDEDIYHIISHYTKDIPQQELKILATHFAGQALLLSLLNNNINLAKVTIKQVMTELKEEVMGMHLYTDKHKKEQQRFEYGRIFTHHKTDSINMNTKEEKLELCKMYLAGFIAEELLLGSCGYSCHADDDKANALGLAQSIAFEGLDIATMPKHIQEQKHDQALALIEQGKKETRELLEKNKGTLQKLADALLQHQTLDAAQVAAIIKG